MLKGKHIIVGICGGIAAYKSIAMIRLLVKAGAEVQPILTPAGREFVTPVTLSALTGKPVITDFFTANSGEWHSHVDLGLWADALLIAPATASSIAKMANGVADNMLITTYLSAKCPVFIAPSMDLDMWAHPSTQRNIDRLKNDGVHIIEPTSGELASHLVGKGRMEEPENIIADVEKYFSGSKVLKGHKILITAGPTYENLDPVRFIGNYSSGKMGLALVDECVARGAEVVLVCGPVAFSGSPDGVKRIEVVSAKEMLAACMEEMSDCDTAIFCAAVADYAPAIVETAKIKREKTETITLTLQRNPDIAASIGKEFPDRMLVGFALETDSEIENAESKMKRKNLKWIVVNSLRDPEAGFGKDTNKITMLCVDGRKLPFEAKSKKAVAADIINTVFDL